jgi:predicted metal-dependent hydrolase
MKAKAAILKKTSEATWYDADELKWAVRQWAVRIGVKVSQLHVRQMKSKWASISTAGRLTLNTDLIDIPRELGEYVIVHELIHLLAPNHGKVFKSFLAAYLPDWDEREEKLKAFADNGAKHVKNL